MVATPDVQPSAAARHAAAQLTAVTDRLPAGESRPQQIAMCEAVASAIAKERHLVVQAGTGTGKSLAYTVPAVASGKRVIVATATKALQDQLAEKDLPAVVSGLDRPVTFAVLKGRSNYLCRQRAAELEDRGFQQAIPRAVPAGGIGAAPAHADDPSSGDAQQVDPALSGDDQAEARDVALDGNDRLVDQVRHLLLWGGQTATGDRAELTFEPHPRAWNMVSVTARECPGAYRCPSGSMCFAERARAEAAEADVVVVNTYLYGAHLASGGAVLPPHDVVIFDEAHEVESVMTDCLGIDVIPGRFRALVAAARPHVGDHGADVLLDELGALGDRFRDALRDRIGTRVLVDPATRVTDSEDGVPSTRERVRAGPPRGVGDPEDATLSALLELASSRVDRLMHALRKGASARPVDGSTPEVRRRSGGRHADESARLARALSACGHLAEDLARIAARSPDEIVWVDGTTGSPVLRLSPIDVGPSLAGRLWGEVTAVLTSATIPARLSERLGLTGFAFDVLDVGSPFHYQSHALLYIARHLPDPRRPEYEPAMHDELEHLIRAAGGRTLSLFTSHRSTTMAAEALRPRLPVHVWAQGDLPKPRLLEVFSGTEESCLFATLGFWQGVDVPGRSLSLVTLDRLPFARPDDPLLEARREEAGAAAFRLIDLPRAATLLAQGVGRLIRTADDFGVVAVLDSRLATAGYGRAMLATLPPMRRTTERRQVEEFFRRILAPASGASEP